MSREETPQRLPHSLHAYFLRPGTEGDPVPEQLRSHAGQDAGA